jgi:sporulation protein YqfC
MDKTKKIKNKGRIIGETFANAFDLPKEVMIDIPKILIIGDRQITIENHRGLIQYTDNFIRICVSGGELIIKGNNLVIVTILSEEIKIAGLIKKVLLEN